MREIYKITIFNLKTATDKYSPPIKDLHETGFKVGDMFLLKNNNLTTTFVVKNKTSYRICKWLSDKAFDIQNNTGKNRCASIHHLQLSYPTEQVLAKLSDMTSFGQRTKDINHPKLMPTLHVTETKDKPK